MFILQIVNAGRRRNEGEHSVCDLCENKNRVTFQHYKQYKRYKAHKLRREMSWL